ncbi:MAG TPA: hypothetical protein ENL35_09145 [Chloroflexi bacterium]|nr:hypothetical protein [Chloroflexota bacterium]
MVDLARAGQTPEALAREFDPAAASMRKWLKQANLGEGRRHDRMTTAEHWELARLRCENKQLDLGREILAERIRWIHLHARGTDG